LYLQWGENKLNDADRLDQAIASALDSLNSQYGSVKRDYYGLIFLEQVLALPRAQALSQTAFGNHDLGVDGFHFDTEQETFRIFQFKHSKNARLFEASLLQLHQRGISALFGDLETVPDHQPIIDAARRSLHENKDSISQIFIDFVFLGEPTHAEQSRAVAELKSKIEEEDGWIIEQFFKEPVPITVRFLTFDGFKPATKTSRFTLRLRDFSKLSGPDGMEMYVGFVPLADLHGINSILGRRFLERNIRFALPPDGAVNRALSQTFSRMLLRGDTAPEIFGFHHNGVTLSAAKVEVGPEETVVINPRLLNGAQTVSTFSAFWDHNAPAFRTVVASNNLDKLKVLCRIITKADDASLTEITISNNRQNPVLAWQLHANDQIQLQLEDWFADDGIPYQRQHRAFSKVAAQDWQQMDFTETKAIELLKLARTYLCVEGNLNKASHISEQFESEAEYADLFGPHRLEADRSLVILCYKAGFRRRALVNSIKEKGEDKYYFLNSYQDLVWGLTCQAMLNHPKIDQYAENFGHDLALKHEFVEMICGLASTKVRPLLSFLLKHPAYSALTRNQNYGFLKTTEAFTKAMTYAKNEGWKIVKLR
jgi:hypothetical protein